MDRWEFAVERYRQIVPEPLPDGLTKSQARKLRIWLSDDVLPVVEEYSRRITFRAFASWPVSTLHPGARSTERAVIDALQQNLPRCAIALEKLAQQKLVSRALLELNPPSPIIISPVVIGSGLRIPQNSETVLCDELAVVLGQVSLLASRPPPELLRVDDYFEPVQETPVTATGERVQRGDLNVSLNPELHPIGNFVVRGFFQRLEWELSPLTALRRKCRAAVRKSNRPYAVLVENLRTAWNELQGNVQKLKSVLQTGPKNLLRDSCVILTQVYAAIHPEPDVNWLGLPSEIVRQSVEPLRRRLAQPHSAEMFARIAMALAELSRLPGLKDDSLDARAEAIAAGHLVLIQRPPEVYWERAPVEGPWKGILWQFLSQLARKAQRRASVGQEHLYTEPKSDNIMARNAERLKQQLPPSLRRLIISGSTPQTYRLDLEPQRIRID